MGLNRRSRTIWASALMLAAVWATTHAAGTFADSAGFSGKVAGQTCIACHTPASPLQDDAKAVLEGLPKRWVVGVAYPLNVHITGGPAPMPAPQPQGGFDIQSDGGRFELAGSQGLLRSPSPQEVTYLPAGTLQRSWNFTWVAPGLETRPAPVQVWLAVLAANGNHVIATNRSDQGETLDSADALTVVVQPDASAAAAWNALPLAPPSATLTLSGSDVRAEGKLGDANATQLLWRLDDEAWALREATDDWTIRLPGLPAGEHTLHLQTAGTGRHSAVVNSTFQVQGNAILGTHPTPGPALSEFVIVTFAATTIRTHRRVKS